MISKTITSSNILTYIESLLSTPTQKFKIYSTNIVGNSIESSELDTYVGGKVLN